ncbi:MAG: prolyl oligopeptidase family serine peptidase [Clostridia bacterium]|nr:prolyl oligopeptidase family serine peptidase [Clostridia bacterium]
MEFKISRFECIEFMMRYPNGYESGKHYPVIISLHGAGTRGEKVEQLREQCCYRLTDNMENFASIMITPLCPANTWFDVFETLKRFVTFVADSEFCDRTRLYLMGGSMGGYAAWQLAMSMPEAFAALVPICGGGMYWNASRLADVPVWAFHGAKDPTVLCRESEILVEKVNKHGGNAKLTIYPENKHDAWTDTYSNPEVYAWMLSHRKQNAQALAPDTYSNNAKEFG